jgi:hypothetical protein
VYSHTPHIVEILAELSISSLLATINLQTLDACHRRVA